MDVVEPELQCQGQRLVSEIISCLKTMQISLRFSSKELRENNLVSSFCALGKTFQTRTECQVNSENYDEM